LAPAAALGCTAWFLGLICADGPFNYPWFWASTGMWIIVFTVFVFHLFFLRKRAEPAAAAQASMPLGYLPAVFLALSDASLEQRGAAET
jgi:hypothetical protein